MLKCILAIRYFFVMSFILTTKNLLKVCYKANTMLGKKFKYWQVGFEFVPIDHKIQHLLKNTLLFIHECSNELPKTLLIGFLDAFVLKTPQ